MRTYPEYKDSGVEWIGEIPIGWEIKRLKYSSDLIVEKELPSDGDIKISPENVESYTGKVINYHSDYETEGMKFQKGDTLLNKLRVYLSKFVFCESDGFSMGEMLVLRPHEYLPKFQYYLLSNPKIIEHFNSLSQGVKVPRPPVNEMLSTLCPVLPLSEQKQISDYLDRKTQKINDLIEKTEWKIELLKEHRSYLINQCVTKGLDPNTEMKDSGVKWIGEIPKGWKICKLKHVSTTETGTTPSTSNEEFYLDGDTLWVKPDDLREFTSINTTKQKLTREGLEVSRPLKSNSVLVCGIGSIGKFGFSTEVVCTNQQINGISFDQKKFDQRFGLYLVSSLSDEFIRLSEKVVVSILNKTRQENTSIVCPPLPEQKKISDYLDQETSKIDQMVDTETKRIEILKEYRQSLISKIVTGKIRVTEDMI